MASSSCNMVTVEASALLLLCAATLASSASMEKGTSLCGKSLVDALIFLCDGVIFDATQKRHAGPPTISLVPPWMSLVEGGNSKLGFLDAETALQLLRPAGRQTRGIVEECCHKSCSVHELQSYCGMVQPGGDE